MHEFLTWTDLWVYLSGLAWLAIGILVLAGVGPSIANGRLRLLLGGAFLLRAIGAFACLLHLSLGGEACGALLTRGSLAASSTSLLMLGIINMFSRPQSWPPVFGILVLSGVAGVLLPHTEDLGAWAAVLGVALLMVSTRHRRLGSSSVVLLACSLAGVATVHWWSGVITEHQIAVIPTAIAVLALVWTGWKGQSFSLRLIAGLLLPVIVLGGILPIARLSRLGTEGTGKKLEAYADRFAEQYQDMLAHADRLLLAVSASPSLQAAVRQEPWNGPAVDQVLDRYAGVLEQVVLYVLDRNGVCWHASNRKERDTFVGFDARAARREYYTAVMKGQTASTVAIGKVSGVAGRYRALPIHDAGGKINGVLCLKIVISPPLPLINSRRSEAFVVDGQDAVMASTTGIRPGTTLTDAWMTTEGDRQRAFSWRILRRDLPGTGLGLVLRGRDDEALRFRLIGELAFSAVFGLLLMAGAMLWRGRNRQHEVQGLLDRIDAAMLLLDQDGCIHDANAAAHRLFGLSQAGGQRLGREVAIQGMGPDDLVQLLVRVGPGREHECQWTLPRADVDRVVHVMLRSWQQDLLLATVHDVTSRVASQRRLAAINHGLLGFGADAQANIQAVVRLAGEILGGTAALYSRLQGNRLTVVTGLAGAAGVADGDRRCRPPLHHGRRHRRLTSGLRAASAGQSLE